MAVEVLISEYEILICFQIGVHVCTISMYIVQALYSSTEQSDKQGL